MLKIKISLPGPSKIEASQFLGNKNNEFEGCRLYINDDDERGFDCWFVIDDLPTNRIAAEVRKNNTFFVNAEVIYPPCYYDRQDRTDFISQFQYVRSCHDILGGNVTFDLPFLPWMINANHGSSVFAPNARDVEWLGSTLRPLKNKLLSVFCSAQAQTDDHRLRLKFVKSLKEYFGNNLDWFGNGINPLDQKWDGISTYKYHIALENQSRRGIITEKLYDGFLGGAYPIYYGAPDAADYFPSESFSSINIYDIRGSIAKIEGIISSDLWESASLALEHSKRLVLDEYNIFKRICRIALSHNAGRNNPFCMVSLESLDVFRAKQCKREPLQQIASAVSHQLQKLATKLSR